MERQKIQNKQISRITESTTQINNAIIDTDKEIILEMEKYKSKEKQEEEDNVNANKLVKFKNITNNSSKNNPVLDYSAKTLKIAI